MSKKFQVMLTFDVDGETLWTSKDADKDGKNRMRPSMLSLGTYGAEVAVPRILRLLERYDIKATFFIPGETACLHPDMVVNIYEKGHEIGNHGYSHTCPDTFETYEEEIKEYEDANNVIKELTGEMPKGFRAPSWEYSVNTFDIVKKMGFVYDSTMMGKDSLDYLKVSGEGSGIVEIPINWSLDDAPFWLLSGQDWGAPMTSPATVYDIWKDEFEYLYDESFDNVFTLTCHPQLIGRPARMKMYERLVDFLAEHDDVEFVRCIDAAEKYRDGNEV